MIRIPSVISPLVAICLIHWILTPKLPGQTPSKVSQAVLPFVEKNELAGAVMLVATKDQVLTAEAVGWADIDAKKPMATDSLFWIASQSKPITGAALMILVDEGKVKLDDPVEKFLPEFRGQMVEAEKEADHNFCANQSTLSPFAISLPIPVVCLFVPSLRCQRLIFFP